MAAFQATLKKVYIRIPEFFGVGLDDLTSSGTYTGTTGATYTVIIGITGVPPTPDTFKWQKDDGAFTTGVNCAITAITLSDGVQITFGAINGHTSNEKWEIEAVAPQIDAKLDATGTILSMRDHSNYLTNTDVGHAETDFSGYRRLYLTPLNGTPIDLNEISAILPHYTAPAANSDVITYSSIGSDDVYELTLITVPAWNNAITYITDMCVYYQGYIYKANITTTPGIAPPAGVEWAAISTPFNLITGEVSTYLSTAYYETSTIAIEYLLLKANDEYVHEFHCTLASECSETFCKNPGSIKMFKSWMALRGTEIGIELGEWNKVQTILIGANNLFNTC